MRENKVIGWISLALFAAALGVMLALFAVAGLGLEKSIEKYITINVDLVLLAVSLLAFIASVLGFLAFKTIQGKIGSVGGLILFLVAAGMFAMTISTREGRTSRSTECRVRWRSASIGDLIVRPKGIALPCSHSTQRGGFSAYLRAFG